MSCSSCEACSALKAELIGLHGDVRASRDVPARHVATEPACPAAGELGRCREGALTAGGVKAFESPTLDVHDRREVAEVPVSRLLIEGPGTKSVHVTALLKPESPAGLCFVAGKMVAFGATDK